MKPSIVIFNKYKDLFIGLSFILLLAFAGIASRANGYAESWSNFTTVFLGIFIEAIPFLLMGTLASGLVEVFISPDFIERVKPKSAWLSALLGVFLGLVFPVCECGVVPLVRRLYHKGLPIATGIAFLLAAPVINPVVILSTASAFGLSSMLWMRMGFTILIAFITGLVFTTAGSAQEVLRDGASSTCDPRDAHACACAAHAHAHTGTPLEKIEQVLSVAADELFDMGRYLILGALLSAGMQTFIPQSILLEIGGGAVLSVLVMIALAVLLSICSTVDSFVALSFIGSFSQPSVLAFLLYGPMVDIKSMLMFTRVYKRRAVAYLLLIPLVLTILVSVSLNYFWV